MIDPLAIFAEKSESPFAQHLASTCIGVIAGSVATVLYVKSRLDTGRTLVLCQEAFDALTNDETNFVRFTSTKHEHVFRVTLEQ